MCAGGKERKKLWRFALTSVGPLIHWPPSQMKLVLSLYTSDTDTKQVLRDKDVKAITQGARADGAAAAHTSCSPPQDSIMYSVVL